MYMSFFCSFWLKSFFFKKNWKLLVELKYNVYTKRVSHKIKMCQIKVNYIQKKIKNFQYPIYISRGRKSYAYRFLLSPRDFNTKFSIVWFYLNGKLWEKKKEIVTKTNFPNSEYRNKELICTNNEFYGAMVFHITRFRMLQRIIWMRFI